jgi:hypothetical protein
MLDADVLQAQVLYRFVSHCHLPLGEIHAHELAPWQMKGHGNQVAAACAAKLEDTAPGDRCGGHAEETAQSSQPVQVALLKGAAFVGNLVVCSNSLKTLHWYLSVAFFK